MVIHSPFPNVDFQRTNIVFRLFPPGGKPSEEPLWIDSKDTKVSLSPAQLLGWMKRLACGLGKAGLKRGDVVMIYTPNHIFVPASYLGVAGGGYAFSGASPVYTANGGSESCAGNEVILSGSNRIGTSIKEYRSSNPARTSSIDQERHRRRKTSRSSQESRFPILRCRKSDHRRCERLAASSQHT